MQTKRKSGQSIVEFGLILALVAIVGMLVMQSLGDHIKATFTGFTGKMQNANSLSDTASTTP